MKSIIQTRHIVGIGIGLLIVMALMYGMYVKFMPATDAPQAKRGILDLSGWDFATQGQVYLDGEWEYYEDVFLAPTELVKQSSESKMFLTVPSTWKDDLLQGRPDQQGYGTYRLTVKVSKPNQVFGMKISNIRMAHRLFINGKLEGESGQPTKSDEQHRPGNTPYSVYFYADRPEIEIIVQVSNYLFPTGGISGGISFGLQDAITKQNQYEVGSILGILMLMTVFALYHLGIYIMRRKERTYLYIGLFLCVSVCMNLLYDEKIALQFLPEIPFMFAYKVLELAIFLTFVLFNMVICSVDERLMSKKLQYWLLAPIVGYCILVLLLPYTWHIRLRNVLFIYAVVMLLYTMWKMIVLLFKTYSKENNQSEQLLFLGGFLSVIIYICSGLLNEEELFPMRFTEKSGLIGFVLFMSLLLTLRFTRAYEQSEELAHQLELSNKLKDEFLTNTTHEIKTPLHGIMNTAEFLLEDTEQHLTSDQQRHVRLIKETSTKLSFLIRDLIDVIHLKYDDIRLEPTVVDVRVAVQMSLDLLRFELAGKSITLVNAVDAHVRVCADENRFRQVLYNLIHNAIKYTEEGSIRVFTETQGTEVVLAVEDTGCGIDAGEFERIFQYFERLEPNNDMERQSGMGVGLYVSKQLVERMGGRIWVEYSAIGQGTQMRLCLQRAEVVGDVSPQVAASMEVSQEDGFSISSSEEAAIHPHTILIVDDEPSNIQVLVHMLKRKYNVVIAYSAKEAREKLMKHRHIDLVILDVMMPGTSGIELCRMIRKRHTIVELPGFTHDGKGCTT